MTMVATVEVLPPPPSGTSQLVLDLGEAGQITRTGLALTNADLDLEKWLELGKNLGDLYRIGKWSLGDWLVFGEAVYSEDDAWSQGVDAAPAERYSVAQRVTGLEPGTLMNIASVCRRVPRLNSDGGIHRREELQFEHHAEVAKLEVPEQARWLALCIEQGWTKAELRERIADDLRGPDDDPDPDPGPGRAPTRTEEEARVLRLVWKTLQRAEDGSALIPASTVAELAAVLGEEE